jgi:hypothetical protein
MNKEFDCVDYQRKIRDKLFVEAEGNVNKLFELLREKTTKSEFVKAFKERNKILIKAYNICKCLLTSFLSESRIKRITLIARRRGLQL